MKTCQQSCRTSEGQKGEDNDGRSYKDQYVGPGPRSHVPGNGCDFIPVSETLRRNVNVMLGCGIV